MANSWTWKSWSRGRQAEATLEGLKGLIATPRSPALAATANSNETKIVAFDQHELDTRLADYEAAVAKWIKAIREEAALASVEHSIARLDEWQQAHFREQELHRDVIRRRKLYEDALRRDLYGV